MDSPPDSDKTQDVVKQIELAKTGRYKKWKAVVKKAKRKQELNNKEVKYYSNAAKTDKNTTTIHKSKIYHIKLSEYDEKHPCNLCGENSSYYCNMNDQYFCTVHLVGHDENEF